MLETFDKNKQQKGKWCFENEQEKELQQKIPKHPPTLCMRKKQS
jgi:hypothetical protein